MLDLKPYVPYADSIPRARAAWADDAPKKKLKVRFSRLASRQCRTADPRGARELRLLIAQMLRLDPRPAFQRSQEHEVDYAFRLEEFDVHWNIHGDQVLVTELKAL